LNQNEEEKLAAQNRRFWRNVNRRSQKAVVTIDGRDFYLGKHGTAAATAKYAVLIGDYHAVG
jgi:hypothetical protein